MSLLQRYNSENHYVIISHIHIIIHIIHSHRRPTPRHDRRKLCSCTPNAKHPIFIIIIFFLLLYFTITRNEVYTPKLCVLLQRTI